MSQTIKAIETHYKGYRFRSRLEARWAVFFDAVGIVYQYEPQGFNLGGICYLPDFYLPPPFPGIAGIESMWLEVKPTAPTEDDIEKIARLATASGVGTAILVGDPWYPGPENYALPAFDFGLLSDGTTLPIVTAEDYHFWSECPVCGTVMLTSYGQIGCWGNCVPECFNLKPGCGPEYVHWFTGVYGPRLMRAYKLARAARFEHGEKPEV